MQVDKRKIAPMGLVLAALALLVAGGLYVVFKEFSVAVKVSLALVPVGLALYALLDPRGLRQALTGRQARYGSNALVMSLAFLGIVIVANYLAYDNNKTWDLTEDKTNTLAQETVDTLAKLETPVHAQAFFSSRLSPETAQKLLERYADKSNGKFTYEFIDPESEPLLAEQAKITRDGTVVVSMGDRQEQVAYVAESELTNTLVRLMSSGTFKVYFLTGHGEHDPKTGGDASFSTFSSRLSDKNYLVETLNLLTSSTVPEDADLVIVAGPTKPLLEGEVEALGKYVVNGGKLFVMWEPSVMVDFGDTPDYMADYLNRAWGIQVGNDLMVDLVGQNLVQQPFMAVGAEYGSHAITTKLQGMATFFFTARSVTAGTAIDGVTQTEVVKTSQDSWAETDLAGLIQNQPAQRDEGVDLGGPVSLMVIGENFTTQGRVAVVGDVDFATNAYFSAYGNGDLILNTVDWIVGQENLIDLTAKSTTTRTLSLTPTTSTLGLLFLVSVILLPALALAGGVAAFIYRRRRG